MTESQKSRMLAILSLCEDRQGFAIGDQQFIGNPISLAKEWITDDDEVAHFQDWLVMNGHAGLPIGSINTDALVEEICGRNLTHRNEEALKQSIGISFDDVEPDEDDIVSWIESNSHSWDRIAVTIKKEDGPELKTLHDKMKMEWVYRNFDKINPIVDL